MSQAAALMFGTDVVSCIYADRWNQQVGDAEPIVGFIAGEGDAELQHFRPQATVVRDDLALKRLMENRVLRIVCPEHRQAHLESWARATTVLPSSTEVVNLPAPPDYVIEWTRFEGDRAAARKRCEGYDATRPSRHAVETQLIRKETGPGPLTAAQVRQVKVVETLCRSIGRPLRVVDFGGAAGGHYFSLSAQQQEYVESWTVVETPEMSEQARGPLSTERLGFVDSLDEVLVAPDFVLASSSLQYVDDFEGYFSSLLALGAQFFCIDRTPMAKDGASGIYLQRVFRNDGQWQYETSYPLFLHAESRYLEMLSEHYTLMSTSVLHDESKMSNAGKENYFFMLGLRRQR